MFVIYGVWDTDRDEIASAMFVHHAAKMSQIEYLFTSPLHKGRRLAQGLLTRLSSMQQQHITVLQCVSSLEKWYEKVGNFKTIGMVNGFLVMISTVDSVSEDDRRKICDFIHALWGWYAQI
jgi:hypothetical protein